MSILITSPVISTFLRGWTRPAAERSTIGSNRSTLGSILRFDDIDGSRPVRPSLPTARGPSAFFTYRRRASRSLEKSSHVDPWRLCGICRECAPYRFRWAARPLSWSDVGGRFHTAASECLEFQEPTEP